MIEGEFYNDSEKIFVFESDLRKRINPAAMWPDLSTPDAVEYTNAGFYPVEYADLQEFQTHDKTATYLENGRAVVPAVDIPLSEAIPQALGRIDNMRSQKETAGINIEIDGVSYLFSTSQNSQIKVGNVKNLQDGKIREWLMADGKILLLTQEQIDSVFAAMQAHIEAVFAWQAEKNKAIFAAQTTEEVRTIMVGI